MTTAGVLVRISDDRAGEARGVERQEQDCRELAARKGWDVREALIYRENDTSAFKRRKVPLPGGGTALRVVRPEFRRLLDDITSGTIRALVAYDLDRVARDPRDLEDLIDAVEATGIQTATVTGDVNLSSSDGIFMARMMVNVANKSSRDTSRRVQRAMLATAEAGKGGGGLPAFGYSDTYTVHPDEAATVRWLHEQVQAGRSLRSLAVEVAAQHPRRRWDAEAIRRIATNPRYAALREHRGQVVGPARWPAIVTVETLEKTQAVLADRTNPARHVGGPRRYLLTGLLACGRCGARLYPRRNAERQRFGCLPTASGGCGGSLVVYQPAEDLIVDLVLARLASELDTDDPEPDDPSALLRRQIAGLEAQQEQLGRELAEDPSAVLMLRAANRDLAAKVETLRGQLRQIHTAKRLADPQAVVAEWPTYDLDQRRAVVEALIERVVVARGSNGGPKFDPDRLTVVWR